MIITLNAKCSRKCATPLFFSVSWALPVLTKTPMAAVCLGFDSVTTLIPFGSVVSGTLGKLRVVAKCLLTGANNLFISWFLKFKGYYQIGIHHDWETQNTLEGCC